MMTKVFDASKKCSFQNRKIVFDTNIWISIYGNDHRESTLAYSDYFGSVLTSGNELVTNDYIIAEFFNRTHKIQYDLIYRDADARKLFKKRRKSPEFQEHMEAVRDTCHDILRDCTFETAVTHNCVVSDFVSEVSVGHLDFTDIVIREHCARSGYVLVSDDGDFSTCGLELVTANKWVIAQAKARNALQN